MVRSRLPMVAVAALLLGSIALAPSARPLPAVATAGAIAFQVPSVVDPIHTNGEPDIGLDGQGRVFVSGPTGTGTQRSTWFGSVDGGQTFRVITPGPPPSAIAGIVDPPGGGDTDINFDRSGKQYFADLYALACLRTATTSNGGATVNQSIYPAGCSGIPGADRQWLAVYDPAPGTPSQSAYVGSRPLIYMEYNNIQTGAQWVKSNSAVDPLIGGPGLTYVNAEVNGPGAVTGYSPFGADGYPAIDQVSGKVFQAAFNGTSILLNIGTPNAAGDLTFLDDPVTGSSANLITVASNVPANADDAANFVVTSMDSAGNLYVAWVGKSTTPSLRQAFVAAASAAGGWKTWTTAQVSSPPSQVSVFPWVKAGGAGRADVVWYGSNLSVDPSSQSGQSWDVFMSQAVFPTTSSGGVTGGSPSVTQVKVTPHPMHFNDICLAGSTCITQQGNRNLADFFVVTMDQSGAAEIVYDDTSNGLIQPGFTPANTQLVDHAGAGVITIARQSSGTGLFGTAVSGPSSSPVGGLDDPPGDALYPVIGGSNVAGMDILANGLQLSADGHTLSVITRLIDLAHPAATAAAIAGTSLLQYVTRWQMGNTIFYAAMANNALNQPSFYAGKAQSVDLCSVSACFPHVITYPEPLLGGSQESGTIQCPAAPSVSNPCTVTVQVKVADIGNPTATSLLEEVGGYSFVASHPQGATTNLQAEADNVPLEIDGVCCYNFEAAVQNGGPPPCHEADGTGDIHSTGSGKASFSMDEDHCEDLDTDDVHARDSSAGINFQSTQILSATFNDALNSVVIAGNGTDNGNPVTFTATAVSGSAGVGTFGLTLSDGYTNNGPLLDGAIQLQ